MIDAGQLFELWRWRLPLENEKDTQQRFADLLTEHTIPFEREALIAGGKRIDFLLADGTGIEIKLAGSAKSIYRQLEGYSAEPRIERLVLLTAKAMALPPLIGGKRARVINLGRAWL